MGRSCTRSRPSDGVADVVLRDSQFCQFGSYRVCLPQSNLCQHDIAVLNGDVAVFGLADGWMVALGKVT